MAQTGYRETAARAATKSLVAKGDASITAPPSGPTQPTTYLVYSFKRIIERRAERGLLYCERDPGGREVKLLTTAEAFKRWQCGDQVKQRPEHSFGHAPNPAAPPAAGEIAKLPAASASPAERPARSSVTPIRKNAIVLKPEDWAALHAELGELADGNVTAEADLLRADLADNPGQPIEATVLKVRGLAHQVRASRGGIHSPIAWMLSRIGAMVVDVEAETARARAEAAETEAAATARARADAARAAEEKKRRKISPADAEKGAAAWTAILAELEKTVIRQSYETWLKPTKGAWLKAKTLTVTVPSPEFQHIGDKYGDLLQAAIQTLGLKLKDIRLVAPETYAPSQPLRANDVQSR
jgi:hypothetical protein